MVSNKSYLKVAAASLIATAPFIACSPGGDSSNAPTASSLGTEGNQGGTDGGSGGGQDQNPEQTPIPGQTPQPGQSPGPGQSPIPGPEQSPTPSPEVPPSPTASPTASPSPSPSPAATEFSGIFQPLNIQAVGSSPGGVVNLSTANDQFTAQVNANGLSPNVTALQHVHTGSRCPTQADDTNGDGYVDAVEEGAVSGEILIPLDDDLSSQSATQGPTPSPSATPSASPAAARASRMGRSARVVTVPLQAVPTGYPITDATGAYNYQASTDLTTMLADLMAEDPNPNDDIAKLAPGEDLNLSSRVVIIHGVPADTVLPATVQTVEGLSPQATLPVACAALQEGALEPQPSPSPSATPQASPSPSPSPSATPSPSPTATPTASPSPSPTPTASPSPTPSISPTPSPTP